MKYQKTFDILMFLLSTCLVVSSSTAAEKEPETKAADTSQSVGPLPESTGAERVNVENIKEKYWARGEENEMGVVQNRTYSKERKWELGVYGGVVLTDPFLNVSNAGISLGYHFSEYFAVQANVWKDFTGYSSALETFQRDKNGIVNYNAPHAYYGAEAVGSLLYGKLSVVGKSIIYYDMHVLGGLGLTNTDTGTYLTPDIGLGQQVYISKNINLRLDYRLMFYHEQINERAVQGHIGENVGNRNNWNNVITFGVGFMFGGPKEKEKTKTGGVRQ